MDKMDMLANKSMDYVLNGIERLLPGVLLEVEDESGHISKKVDFELLKQMLSDELISEKEERYSFSWPDKKRAIATSNVKSNLTLRPVISDSLNFNDAKNVYIEGDNLEVLKLLQEAYLGRIKMIYIDPPYNTGNDFIYDDDFSIPPEVYLANSGQLDELGNRLVQNTDSNGRFHTDWLNMMYVRLKLARNLLSEDGVIFISIGQDELANLIKICDEIFGANNRLGIISHQMKSGGGTQGKYFAHNVDYILVYSREYDCPKYFRGEMSEELVKKVYNQVQESGPRKGEHYRTMGLYQSSLGIRPSLRYYIECPDGSLVIPPGETFPQSKQEGVIVTPANNDGVWRWSYDKYQEEFAKGNVEFKESKQKVLLDENGNPSKWNVYTKIWLKDRQDEGTIPSDLLLKYENRHSSKELSELDIPFDFAKPIGLVKYLMQIAQLEDGDIVLDFFSGSATTAHAVMELCEENNVDLHYIMVQLPEACPEKSKAYGKGYRNICQIGEARIRKAAELIKSKNKDVEVGFRVFRLDSSNMKDVYYNPAEIQQTSLFQIADNIKNDRSDEDLLFQVMLDLGVLLSSKVEVINILEKKVFVVENGFLVACFEENISDEIVKNIAVRKPLYAVFRDSSMASDSVATNFEQIFASISPDTIRKVL